MRNTRKIKVIGAGGIGCHLLEPLARYLSYTGDECDITVIDGDRYEDRNRERQRFTECGNKAEHTVAALKQQFPKVHFRAKPEYLTESNVVTAVREKDTVFLCVDNHATRKLVSDRCEELDDVTLISGGNDYTDGDVIVFRRVDGEDVGRPPTKIDRKIASPEDKNPGDLSDDERQGCQREAASSPQLLFANLAAASHMLNLYYRVEQGKADCEQVFFDILTGNSRSRP